MGAGQDHVRAIFAQLVHTFWVGSRKVDWCWSFSSKDVIEISLTTRTCVEPELIYLLSPSHLSSFTDAGMDKETSSPTTLHMEKREG